MSAHDPAALLVRAQAGDGAAFAELAEPYRGELLAHCYRMLGAYHEAEDVLQETITRAWRALSGFDGRRGIRPWLYRIATNRCLTWLGQRRHRELPTDFSEGAAAAAEAHWIGPFPDHRMDFVDRLTPEARFVAWESVRLAFVAALQQLPARQRAVLLLRDVLGFSAQEAADVLDVSVASVNSALQRARRSAPLPTERANEPEDTTVREVAVRYAAAWESADIEAIVAMLAADARYSMPPLWEVFSGRDSISEFLRAGPFAYEWRFLPAAANGELSFATYRWDGAQQAYVPSGLDLVRLGGDRIVEVVSFLDVDFTEYRLPEKLSARR